MKSWFNMNLEPLTWIITHGNSVKVAWIQTHLSCIGGHTSLAYARGRELRITNLAAFESTRNFEDTTSSSK